MQSSKERFIERCKLAGIKPVFEESKVELKEDNNHKLIKDSLRQMKEILDFMKEKNNEDTGLNWQAVEIIHDFLKFEHDRICRWMNIMDLKNNIKN